MIELVSDMSTPELGDESSLSARIRVGSRFKRFLCFDFIYVKYFRKPPKMSSRTKVEETLVIMYNLV
jgi:hypothetical protein